MSSSSAVRTLSVQWQQTDTLSGATITPQNDLEFVLKFDNAKWVTQQSSWIPGVTSTLDCEKQSIELKPKESTTKLWRVADESKDVGIRFLYGSRELNALDLICTSTTHQLHQDFVVTIWTNPTLTSVATELSHGSEAPGLMTTSIRGISQLSRIVLGLGRHLIEKASGN